MSPQQGASPCTAWRPELQGLQGWFLQRVQGGAVSLSSLEVPAALPWLAAPPQSSESAARRPLSLTSAPPPPLVLSLLPPSCDDVGPTRPSRIPPAIVRPFPWAHLRGHRCPDRSHITDSRASGLDSPGQHCPASTAGRTHVPAGLSDASSTRGLLSPPSLPSGAGSPVLGGGQSGPSRGRRGSGGPPSLAAALSTPIPSLQG